MNQVPGVGVTIRGRVFTHGGDDKAIFQLETAQAQGREQVHEVESVLSLV